MFVKTSIFKKLCKEAWKGRGLVIHGNEDKLIISGEYWWVEVGYEEITNPEKAVLVELTGHVPEEGEHFKSYKDDNTTVNQQVMPGYGVFSMKEAKDFRDECVDTPLVITGQREAAVIRCKKTSDCIMIPRIIRQMVIREQLEGDPDPWGALRDTDYPYVVVWTNGLMTVGCHVISVNDDSWQEGFMEFLKEIDLGEKYEVE